MHQRHKGIGQSGIPQVVAALAVLTASACPRTKLAAIADEAIPCGAGAIELKKTDDLRLGRRRAAGAMRRVVFSHSVVTPAKKRFASKQIVAQEETPAKERCASKQIVAQEETQPPQAGSWWQRLESKFQRKAPATTSVGTAKDVALFSQKMKAREEDPERLRVGMLALSKQLDRFGRPSGLNIGDTQSLQAVKSQAEQLARQLTDSTLAGRDQGGAVSTWVLYDVDAASDNDGQPASIPAAVAPEFPKEAAALWPRVFWDDVRLQVKFGVLPAPAPQDRRPAGGIKNWLSTAISRHEGCPLPGKEGCMRLPRLQAFYDQYPLCFRVEFDGKTQRFRLRHDDPAPSPDVLKRYIPLQCTAPGGDGGRIFLRPAPGVSLAESNARHLRFEAPSLSSGRGTRYILFKHEVATEKPPVQWSW